MPDSPTLRSFFIHAFRDVAAYGDLIFSSVRNLPRLRCAPIRMVFYRQIYFTGIEAVFPVAFAGLLVGLAVITQMSSVLGSGVQINVRAINVFVVRELANLITALVVLARSGSAMTSELASMKQRGEIKALYVMGIDPADYLLMPRIIGATIAVFGLTFYFQFMAVLGGMAFASVTAEFNFARYLAVFFASLSWVEVCVTMLKSILFGAIISTVCCHHGIYSPPAATLIPRSTENAMIRCFGFIFGLDALIAVLFT
jgi:phospholipid/cholesterol/gamma-HCH transport system permease protein